MRAGNDSTMVRPHDTSDDALDPLEPGREPSELLSIADTEEASAHYEIIKTSAAGGSSTIFEPDELFLSGALTNYRKPIAAIHAIPTKRDAALKLSSRKLLEALPLAVQLDLRTRKKEDADELIRRIREERSTPLFEIRTRELCRLAGLSPSNLDRIHEALADLVGFTFCWNIFHEDGNVEFEAIAPFIIRRDKGVGARAGLTRFAFEPEILLWFLEPKMWANFSWQVMSGFGAKMNGPGQEAAFGLYQNIWRYIGTTTKVTPVRDLADWIDLIIGPSKYVQVDAKGVKTVVNYKDFKRRQLKPGLDILNAHPALNYTVDFTEERSGHKVARLRFHFTEKVQGTLDLPLGWPATTLKALAAIGFNERDIANLSQLYPYAQVTEALRRFPQAEKNARARGVRLFSRVMYFQGILGNIAKGALASQEDEVKLLMMAEQRYHQDEEQSRLDVLTAKFKAHQRKLVFDCMNEMPLDNRKALYDQHLASDLGARTIFKSVEAPGGAYEVVFTQWLEKAEPALFASFLPAPQDKNLQSWLVWKAANAIEP